MKNRLTKTHHSWMIMNGTKKGQFVTTHQDTAKTIKILMEFEVKTFRENWEIFSPDIHTPSWNTARYKTALDFP